MASDSRQSITIDGKDTQGKRFKVETVNSDAVTKTFYLKEQGVGISTYGVDLLGGTPMSSHIERFRQEALTDKDDVVTVARKLVDYVRGQFSDVDAGFHVCGYRKEGKLSAAHVYSCHVGRNVVERKNTKPDGSLRYGATWSGQIDIITSIVNPVVVKDEKGADKIVRPAAPILWDAMTLQDAIDFSVYAIRTTIDTMRFQARPKNVGGPIDVLVLTPNEGRWISKKELHQ